MKILFFGDSITDAGWVRNGEGAYVYGFGYVREIAGELLDRNPEKYQIINSGVCGNRIVDLYSRIKLNVWEKHPDVLTILVGVNDIWHEVLSQNGVDILRFEKIYDMLIEDTKKVLPNTKIILLEPFVLPGYATKEHFDEFNKVRDYAKVVEKLAKKWGAYFVPLQAEFDKASKKHPASCYLYDGVHPDVAGAKLIAKEWLKCFDENFN
ncbi:MAG: SGNH/GDSL hydrolase family protein [Clostridia bacterium]|nr:SGNH/GDSL hydrolase family protein [Clostridia bacterium]